MKDAKGHGSNAHSSGVEQVGQTNPFPPYYRQYALWERAHPPANYAQFKARAGALDAEMIRASAALKAVPGVGSGAMGLTPDAVRQTPEYRSAKSASDNAFQAIRAYNGTHAGRFKKEIKADIAARRGQK